MDIDVKLTRELSRKESRPARFQDQLRRYAKLKGKVKATGHETSSEYRSPLMQRLGRKGSGNVKK